MHTTPDLRGEDETAVRTSMALVERVRPEDLDRPTPCSDWNLAALLAHMTAQHRGFAAAARGQGASLDQWRVRPLDVDPAADYADASEQVIAAFAHPDTLERIFALPEFGPDVRVPGRQAISFHFIDYVVHGWDVARSLSLPFALPVDLLHAAVPVAEFVPDGSSRLSPGAAFAPRLSTPDDDDDPMTRILTLLGRSPSWEAGREQLHELRVGAKRGTEDR